MRKLPCGMLLAVPLAVMNIVPVAASTSPTPTILSAAPVFDSLTCAILSLIGDKLQIIVAHPQIGTLLDKKQREPPPAIEDPVFDFAASEWHRDNRNVTTEQMT